MPALHEGFITYTPEDLQRDFPFFGPDAQMLNWVKIKTNPDGSIDDKAIGFWTVTNAVCEGHFAQFRAQLKGGEEVIDTKLMPGHYGPEILGQTLGVLAAAKYPEHFAGILPSYRVVEGISYNEPVFPGDQVNACVELLESKFDKKGRLRAIKGAGVIIFNEHLVSAASNIVVALNPLEVGVTGLRRRQYKHQTEPRVEAGFANFGQYFADAAKTLQSLRSLSLPTDAAE